MLELFVALVVTMMLVTLAVPSYERYASRARVSAAIDDIARLSQAVERFRVDNGDRVPLTLEDMGIPVPLDPWGQPYAFVNISAAGGGAGALREDGKLNQLNTDFDLYSNGEDGRSAGPLSAEHSRDDVVRANNGAFIGLGEDY